MLDGTEDFSPLHPSINGFACTEMLFVGREESFVHSRVPLQIFVSGGWEGGREGRSDKGEEEEERGAFIADNIGVGAIATESDREREEAPHRPVHNTG